MSSVLQGGFGKWPAHGLEHVPACPLCGSGARAPLHAGLHDHAFASASGEWALHRCEGCGCAYLDPRPDAATLPLAYRRYYTHASGPRRSALGRLRLGIQNAYLNDRYGTAYPYALPAGQHLARLVPRARAYLDVGFARHLDAPRDKPASLLDVGCGDGMSLQLAARMGWEAEGIDFDEAAVAAARAAGCQVVHGSLDDLPFAKERYQHVMLSHVLEHVRDPLALLRRCFELLAPGGRLWLATPNLKSFGHEVFGASWRGLEPPRHLVLFERHSLTAALASAGFSRIEFRSHPGVAILMWEQSRRIARASGRHPAGLRKALLASLPGIAIAEIYEALRGEASEFLTVLAFKQGREEGAGA